MEKKKETENRVTEDFIMRPTVDFCFKELMQNDQVRKAMIAAVLGRKPEEIAETKLLPTVLKTEYPDEKYGILDVKVLLQDGTKIDLEMQVMYFAYWTERLLFYLGKMYTEQLKKGEGYEDLKKCVQISILNFKHFEKDDRCYRKIMFCDTKTGEPYTDLMEIHILELCKLPQEEQNETEIIRWMRFLGAKSRKEFEKMAEKDPYMQEAYDMLEQMSADERKRLEYEAREKAIRDYNTQMYSARKQGITDIITVMLKKGNTAETIASMTDVSLETVKEIEKKILVTV